MQIEYCQNCSYKKLQIKKLNLNERFFFCLFENIGPKKWRLKKLKSISVLKISLCPNSRYSKLTTQCLICEKITINTER